MSDIPKTQKAFERWWKKNRATFPPELDRKAELATLALWTLENNSAKNWEATRKNAPSAWTSLIAYLTDFAEAYGAWKASGGKVIPFKAKRTDG